MSFDPGGFDGVFTFGFDMLVEDLEKVTIGNEAPWFLQRFVEGVLKDFVECVNKALAV